MSEPNPKIDFLLSEAEKGVKARDALRALDDYIWPKLGKIIDSLKNCPDDHASLLAFKYGIKSLLAMRDEFTKADDLGEIASLQLKAYYLKQEQRRKEAMGGQK